MRALFTYTGSTPGADSAVYTLFDSTNFAAGVNMQHTGIQRLLANIENSHAGTLMGYHKRRSSTVWLKSFSQAVPARMDGAMNQYDFMVFDEDVKLEWTNGGSAQTTWAIEIEGHADRSPIV